MTCDGDWFRCPIGEEFTVLCLHPYKDEVLLLGISGITRWIPAHRLETHWTKLAHGGVMRKP